MRNLVLGAALLCGAACLPDEPYWWIQDARVVGVRMSVVEPGGYAALLSVPEGQRRATALPLDTVELEWLVAAPREVSLQPPIWLACTGYYCIDRLRLGGEAPPDCPRPLPFDLPRACRLGEGSPLRVGFAGAFAIAPELFLGLGVQLLAVGSRSPDVTPETCLERYRTVPHADLEPCLLGRGAVHLGPEWAALPFSPDPLPIFPELLEQDVDTHPDIIGFRVTRERGDDRVELLVAPGDTVRVAPLEQVTVLPLLVGGGAQQYIEVRDPDDAGPLPPEPVENHEYLWLRAQMTALVDRFEDPGGWTNEDHRIHWIVPEHPEPATLYVDVHDNRDGFGFAALHFDLEAP